MKTTSIPVLLFGSCSLWLVFCATSASAADCLGDCMRVHGCWGGGSSQMYCSVLYPGCLQSCRESNQKSYPAIAYSAKDKGCGWSYGYDSQGKAEKVAVDNCSHHGSACKSIVWYANKQRAAQRALDQCAKDGGKNCTLQTSQCSGQ